MSAAPEQKGTSPQTFGPPTNSQARIPAYATLDVAYFSALSVVVCAAKSHLTHRYLYYAQTNDRNSSARRLLWYPAHRQPPSQCTTQKTSLHIPSTAQTPAAGMSVAQLVDVVIGWPAGRAPVRQDGRMAGWHGGEKLLARSKGA